MQKPFARTNAYPERDDVIVRSRIDHLVVTAPSLAEGAEFLRQALGVEPQPGGEHPRMGTHNLLVRLSSDVYLEVIAINPGAPAPGRPRWFQLDDAPAGSRLATWVARTNNIDAAAAAATEPLGNVASMTRDSLHWKITVPSAGRMPLNGVAPALIQWAAPPHPASRMQDLGCTLVRLEAFHPEPQRIQSLLEAIGFEARLDVLPLDPGGSPHLVAHIATPHGLRSLGSAAA